VDEQGARLLPSVVSFHPNGEVLVGTDARARRVIDAKNTIASHKRLIGRPWDSPEITQAASQSTFVLREGPGQTPLIHARGQDYTLPEISAFVLKRVRQIASRALGSPIERAVITVPAHFNELQRASTKVAGRVAGLDVLRILNEPTAAALAYGLGNEGYERVAVYDFGGGTFDCTLLDLHGGVFEVLATSGDSFLGGDDIDHLITERMAEVYLRTHRYDIHTDPERFERLKAAAEDLKMALSSFETHTVTLESFGIGAGGRAFDFSFTMTRRDLDALIAKLVDRSFQVTLDALSLARLTPTSFDKVILVGGSTRIPLVRARVEAFFGRAPLDRVNPDEVVAVGAAIQAAALASPTRLRSIPAPPNVIGKPHTLSGLADVEAPADTFDPPVGAPRLAPPAPMRAPHDSAPTRRGPPPSDDGTAGARITRPGSIPPQTEDAPAPRTREYGPGQRPFGAIDEPTASHAFEDETQADTRPRGPSQAAPSFGQATAPLAKFRAPLQTPVTTEHASQAPPPRTEVMPRVGLSPSTAPLLRAPFPSSSSLPAGLPRWAPSNPPPKAPPSVPVHHARVDTNSPFTTIMPAPQSVTAPILLDVTPRGLVVETAGGYCDTILPRNAKIPCERTRRFSAASDMQTSVRVRIAQGEHSAFTQNTWLGELSLDGLRAAPRGQVVIAVTFEVDANNTLRVRARDVETGKEARATLHLRGIATESAVAEMIQRNAMQAVVGTPSRP
jgi:molecular chaperone DnaK